MSLSVRIIEPHKSWRTSFRMVVRIAFKIIKLKFHGSVLQNYYCEKSQCHISPKMCTAGYRPAP